MDNLQKLALNELRKTNCMEIFNNILKNFKLCYSLLDDLQDTIIHERKNNLSMGDIIENLTVRFDNIEDNYVMLFEKIKEIEGKL